MKISAFLLLSVAGPASGQMEGIPAPSNVQGAQYPRINPDHSVTFRIKADDARRVTIDNYDLVKGEDGFWTVTTKPYAPGFRYYFVVVDDFSSTDPGSQTFFGFSKEVSGLEVPGPDADFFTPKDVPHGVVRIN